MSRTIVGFLVSNLDVLLEYALRRLKVNYTGFGLWYQKINKIFCKQQNEKIC